MLYSEGTLRGYKLLAKNGEVGKVKEFYFDDHYWIVRYMVADPGARFTDSRVLISPIALGEVNEAARTVAINLTKENIAASPGLNSDKPISRQFEKDYFEFYGWPYYWGGWGNYPYLEPGRSFANEGPEAERACDPNLRSTHEVAGYHIEAKDGVIGHVKDFMIEENTWVIRYLVVATHNWWPGKVVLISPQWIDHISWHDSKVFVNLSREEIKSSPEFTEREWFTREYEIALHRHYNRHAYWVDEDSTRDHLVQRDSRDESGVMRAPI